MALGACKSDPPQKPAKPKPAKAAASKPASAPASKPATPKKDRLGLLNASGLDYVNKDCDGRAPCPCIGVLQKEYGKNSLAKIGLSATDLAKGVPCVMGDFDANGYTDVALLGKKYGTKKDGKHVAAGVQVLMFDELGLRATAPLPKRMTSLKMMPAPDNPKRSVLTEPGAEGVYYFKFDGSNFQFTRR